MNKDQLTPILDYTFIKDAPSTDAQFEDIIKNDEVKAFIACHSATELQARRIPYPRLVIKDENGNRYFVHHIENWYHHTVLEIEKAVIKPTEQQS